VNFFKNYFESLAKSITSIQSDKKLLLNALDLIQETGVRNGKIIFAGNGGSAAMASHVSVDFTKTLGLRSVNFNEADLITCFANDFGYGHWLEKALEFYADPKDLVVLISSSGRSGNILNAAKKAKVMNLPLITLSGFKADNPLRKMGDLNFYAQSCSYNIVEMTHLAWLLSLLDKLIEENHKNTKRTKNSQR